MTKHKENYDFFDGSIVSNPFEYITSQTNINVVSRTFIPEDPHGAHTVEDMSHYEGVLLSVHFVDKENTWTTCEDRP